ncbi:amino acid adenylation domain-containing protein [Actinomadura sp. GTD37]|uniref:amino acid adenylation domain-containing protein n=1 Tax=Actinomadura sp. GTD37 TaxID=1778030 RepID=UPI0035C23B2B
MSRAGRTLTESFQEVAGRFPDRIAVTAPGGDLTYRQLDERAGALADELVRAGVGRGAVVGLVVPRSAELIVGMLGILKAGAAYLPIDPEYPAARVAWTIRDSGSPAVVSTAATAGALSGLEGDPGVHVVEMERVDPGSLPGAGPRSADLPAADGGDVAYVIYTSGTTGDPKGVQVEHRNVMRLFEVTRARFGFGEDDVWSVFHSAAFDFSVWEIWGALLFGGRLVIVPRETAVSPEAFHGLLAEQEVTVLNQTPSAFRRLMAVDARAGRELAALRLVVFGGEALDPATLRLWIERHGDRRPRLVNMYGITEATVHASYRPVDRADLDHSGPSPIGEPLPDLEFHVLDAAGRRVAPGEAGELHIEGPGVARGYLGRPEPDAERFAERVDSGGVRRRRLRTGDRVVALRGGGYGHLGRVDDQLKIRGYRVEPREIEAVLTRHPRVAQAVVVPHDYGDDDVRLIAHVQSPANETALSAELAGLAAEALPPHMRPSRYFVLEALPLTLNGKVDKARLTAPEPPAPSPSTAARPGDGGPSSAEDRIVEIWRSILGVQDVARDLDFFAQGGTSLSLLRMFERVNEAFNSDLEITVLLDGATVRALTPHVEAVLSESSPPA